MKKVVFSLFLVLLVAGCNGQDSHKSSKQNLAQMQKQDTHLQPKPKVQWKVNKKYDEKGNVIGYDSIYSYSYSNNGNLPPTVNADSLMQSFRSFSEDNFPSIWDDQDMDHMFPMDSLMNKNFSIKEFLNNNHFQNFPNMDVWMQKMDSIHHQMMQEAYPQSAESQDNIHHKSGKI